MAEPASDEVGRRDWQDAVVGEPLLHFRALGTNETFAALLMHCRSYHRTSHPITSEKR